MRFSRLKERLNDLQLNSHSTVNITQRKEFVKMRDAPWIEAAEKYGCEYMYEFVYGKGDDEDVRDEDSEEED